MIGFTPGWSYLSGLDKFLHMPRRQNPRLLTPAGTISIGGVQAGVQCLAGPSGWHLLGPDRRSGPTNCTAIRSSCSSPATASRFTRGRCQDLCRAGPRRGSWRGHRRTGRRMSKLVITSIGPASSVQDGGRPGAQRYGLTPSGAVDRLALAAANTLVGNELFAAAIEVGPFGATFTARGGAVRVALAGGSRNAEISGRAVAFDTSATLADGETLTLGFARGGSFSLSRDRGRDCGRTDVRQPGRERPRRPRQPLSAPLSERRRIASAPASGAAERRIELPTPSLTRRSASCSGRRTTNFPTTPRSCSSTANGRFPPPATAWATGSRGR